MMLMNISSSPILFVASTILVASLAVLGFIIRKWRSRKLDIPTSPLPELEPLNSNSDHKAKSLPKPLKVEKKGDKHVAKTLDKSQETTKSPVQWKKPLGINTTKQIPAPDSSPSNSKVSIMNQTGKPKEVSPTKYELAVSDKSKDRKDTRIEVSKNETNKEEDLKEIDKPNKTAISDQQTEESITPKQKEKNYTTQHNNMIKDTPIEKRQRIIRPERDEKKEEEEFKRELKEAEIQGKAEAKRVMRPVNLNIDKNARSAEESKLIKEREVNLVRKMCGEFRDIAKLDTNEEKEDRKKEMDKVRSARSYFKSVDKHRSESLSAVPRIRNNREEEKISPHMRLSQFEPGKINNKIVNIFNEMDQNSSMEKIKPPKKKVITLDQVMRKNENGTENSQDEKQKELEELKQFRKEWKQPEEKSDENKKAEFNSKPQAVSVTKRWNPIKSDRHEKAHSMEVPQKINIENFFLNDAKNEEFEQKSEVQKELNEIRDARPTPVIKRWKPKVYEKAKERSVSEHVLQRCKMPDNSWVREKSESYLNEEKRKALEELEFVKRSRLESLNYEENSTTERPSSRIETMTELTETQRENNEKTYTEKHDIEKMEKSELEQGNKKDFEAKCVRFDDTKTEVDLVENTEELKTESKVKQKLQQIKQKTEQEVLRFRQSRPKPIERIENEMEKASETEKSRTSTRSRSLSRLRSAGKKMKDMTNQQLKKLSDVRQKKTNES